MKICIVQFQFFQFLNSYRILRSSSCSIIVYCWRNLSSLSENFHRPIGELNHNVKKSLNTS